MPKAKIKSSKNCNSKQGLTLHFFNSILKCVRFALYFKSLTSGVYEEVQWVKVLVPRSPMEEGERDLPKVLP